MCELTNNSFLKKNHDNNHHIALCVTELKQRIGEHGSLSCWKAETIPCKQRCRSRAQTEVFVVKKMRSINKDKQQGRRKLVKDMTQREHRQVKKKRKKYQRDSRRRQDDLQKVDTPPDSTTGRIKQNYVCVHTHTHTHTHIHTHTYTHTHTQTHTHTYTHTHTHTKTHTYFPQT